MFPKKFVSLINQLEEERQPIRFEPNWAVVHEASSIEEFNAFIEGEILVLRMRYRFSPSSHSDWVCPHSWHRIGAAIGNEEDCVREYPLNSWALKDPVGPVPSTEDILEEVSWRNLLSKVFLKDEKIEKTAEYLRSWYFREACKEIRNHERLLAEWRILGSLHDQEDWKFSSKEERGCFHAKMKSQRINVLDARKKLELYQKTAAPEFLICQAAGQAAREKRILDKMHEALTVCS